MSYTLGLLSSGGFDPSGILVLFGGIGAACLFYIAKQNKINRPLPKPAQTEMPKNNEIQTDAKTQKVVSPVVVKQREVRLVGVDKKTAAMLIAIVCEAVGGDPAALRFVSITKR
jgi:hypothetical protein